MASIKDNSNHNNGLDGLTYKQRLFVECYNGNAAEAARKAGYSSPKQAGCRCLRNPKIAKAIQERTKREIAPEVLSRLERQIFWTRVVLDESLPLRERLKASELLARAQGDFIERREISGPSGGPMQIQVKVVFVEASREEEV